MRLAFLFLFLTVLFYSTNLVAQTDSTFTDTVVIFKDPHIIRHQVVIPSTIETTKKKLPIKLGLYYGAGGSLVKSKEPLIEIMGKSFQNVGLQVGYNLNRVEFSTGVGVLATSFDLATTKRYETSRLQKEIVILAQNTITITDSNGVVTEITTTKYGEITREIRETKQYNENHSSKTRFVQIPIFIGYRFGLSNKRLCFTPGIQLMMHKKLSSMEYKEYKMKNTIWSYGFYLKFEYAIKDHISVELKGVWHQSQGNVYDEARTGAWKQRGINLGINYVIGNY